MKELLTIVAGIALIPVLFAAERVDGQFDRALSVSGPAELDAITGAGGIVVMRGSAGTVRIHGILQANDDWFGPGDAEARMREIERNPPVEVNGNTVRVGRVIEGISLRLEIEVPPGTRVNARANSGGIRVSGVSGPVECRTNSGGIELHDIGGDATATANSGGIRMLRVSGAATAHANSGGVEAYDIGGAIDAHTSSGGIRLSQVHAASIRVQAASGGVRVTLAPGQGYDVSIETASGRIATPEMVVRGGLSSHLARHSAEGRIGGGGPEVRIRSSSGNVRVD